MYQEKAETKNYKESFRAAFGGSCMDRNTGNMVVFQGFREEGRELVEAICVSDVLKERTIQGQKVQQFLDEVRSILKDCTYHFLFPSPEQLVQNIKLSCEIRRNDDKIGYVEDMDYLLDCEYIYKLIFGLPIESDSGMNLIFFIPNELAYYSELFQLGVLKPYEKNSQEPFCRMEEAGKVYIRISNALINLDISCISNTL